MGCARENKDLRAYKDCCARSNMQHYVSVQECTQQQGREAFSLYKETAKAIMIRQWGFTRVAAAAQVCMMIKLFKSYYVAFTAHLKIRSQLLACPAQSEDFGRGERFVCRGGRSRATARNNEEDKEEHLRRCCIRW